MHWGIHPRAQNGKRSKLPKIIQFPLLGQNWAKSIKNGSILIHGSNKIGNMSFENIDISVKNMSKN